MSIVKPRRIVQEKEINIEKKVPTLAQQNSLDIIYAIVSEYDNLVFEYKSNPSSQNKRKMDQYKKNIKNVNSLAEYFLTYCTEKENDNQNESEIAFDTENTLKAPSKIRKLIDSEIEYGNLIKIDGLIRNPKTVPYDNQSATGNTLTIVIDQLHIDNLIEKLNSVLINEPVKILLPCSNMIIIIELGSYSPNMNKDLYQKIRKIIMDYILGHPLLKEPQISTNTNYVLQ